MTDQTDFLIANESDADDFNSDATSGVYLSKTSLAREFQTSRETLTTILDQANVRPAKQRGGFDLYRLRDALNAHRAWRSTDKSTMPPSQRLLAAKAEHEEIKIAERCGSLMRREDVEAHWARVIKVLAMSLEILPDELERDRCAPADVIEYVEKKLDAMRERIYEGICALSEKPTSDGVTPTEPNAQGDE
jgi:hypothetical protein